MDKKEIGARIRNLRKAIGIERKEIANVLSVDVSYVTKIEKGQANYTIDKLLKIAEKLKSPPYNFFSNSPLVFSSEAEKEPAIFEIFPDQETKIESKRLKIREDFIPIRIVAEVSVGPGRIIEREETKGYALINRSDLPRGIEKVKRGERPRIVCVKAQGSSMHPTIRDGSLVALDVQIQTDIQPGAIYMVSIPDEGLTMKRVFHVDKSLVLVADNKDEIGFPRAILLKGLSYNLICGKVIWVWNRLD